jgi:cytosine/adenosine deaminase-related metal-dependent hydrolase
MFTNGIVAVGDISNSTHTAEIKARSKIAYYSFVEMFDFMQDANARSAVEQYHPVYQSLPVRGLPTEGRHKKTLVPHSPYSVSAALFEYINAAHYAGESISIHNQETPAEHLFFQEARGPLCDFYRELNIPMPNVIPTGSSSIRFVMQHLKPKGPLLLVHNTVSDTEDVREAEAWHDQIYWVTCPNANLYIENRLPHYDVFRDQDVTMCIGTDSLASNWQLSVLEEIRAIKKYQSHLSDVELLTWATINGARALGYDDLLGTLEAGKKPGLVLLDYPVNDGDFDLRSVRGCQRII